jgi:hypothetical protein
MTKVYTLKESSLGRIIQHVKGNSKIKSWGIISASRKTNTPKVNKERTKELQAAIRSLNLGYIILEGHWKECQDEDTPYEKCPPSKLEDTIEVTFFVPNIATDKLAALTAKYNQDASVYGKTGSDEAFLLFKNGSTSSLGKMSAGKIGQGFSKIKGRPFTFEQKISYIKELLK